MKRSNLLIIGVTGLPSAGKALFSEVAQNYNFKAIVMGDVIRNECKSRGLAVNRESSDLVMIQLRKEKGKNAVALITIDWINEAIREGITKIIIDGIRSLSEVREFKKYFPNFIVIGIHADPKTRLRRAMSRQRIDDAFSSDAFMKRDKLELKLGIGDVIAYSDILISSNDTIEETKKKIAEVIEELIV